jgi:amidase
MKAQPHPATDAPLGEYLQGAFEMIANTAPLNATGHPAMAVPCGISDGLPISM